MVGLVYIGDDVIGEVDLSVIDESMGAIGGELLTLECYSKYRHSIQQRGIANSDNFNLRMIINGELIKPEGGISITHVEGFEPYVDSAGIDLNKIRF